MAVNVNTVNANGNLPVGGTPPTANVGNAVLDGFNGLADIFKATTNLGVSALDTYSSFQERIKNLSGNKSTPTQAPPPVQYQSTSEVMKWLPAVGLGLVAVGALVFIWKRV